MSLEETDALIPDHDYPSTADNLIGYGAEPTEQCFSLDKVPVDEVDPYQLVDDPDDEEGWNKVARLAWVAHIRCCEPGDSDE